MHLYITVIVKYERKEPYNMNYNNATICLNGHIISEYQKNCQKYCSMCGKETYSFCLNCQAPIRGNQKLIYENEKPIHEVIFVPKYIKPFYCYSCGEPYPWTQKIFDNVTELLSLDEDLNESYKKLIRTAIPELIVDTPTTPIAVAKYKKGTSKAGQALKDSLYQLLVDVISETTKKALFFNVK